MMACGFRGWLAEIYLRRNLREAFIVRVRVDFFEPRDVFLYPVPNKFTKLTTCCL